MTDISKHPLLKQAYEVCQAIELCGASTELTSAVTKASALLRAIDEQLVSDGNVNDFSSALKWLKEGERVCREGWNGKDQWVVLIHPGNAMYTKGGVSASMQPCLGLKNAQGNMQPGWVPSMGDLMARDWRIIV
ncbi:DUF2829 domain-containing protein [Enterobacter roggenkampii]|uniref:DUF2829 domain-containing protein n=1 Tax=Enterobacter roggenkampii TaxID=1812935 RepID=UPI0020762581|nr:DUF2829 domain-containing protein [Enterobacter roggenkampii]MCM6993461.1 DUF2829 domain-containing protein [Enterobacter roggenkampii]